MIAAALLASLMWGVADFLGGRASRVHPAAMVALVGQAVSLVALAAILLIRGADSAAVLPGVVVGAARRAGHPRLLPRARARDDEHRRPDRGHERDRPRARRRAAGRRAAGRPAVGRDRGRADGRRAGLARARCPRRRRLAQSAAAGDVRRGRDRALAGVPRRRRRARRADRRRRRARRRRADPRAGRVPSRDPRAVALAAGPGHDRACSTPAPTSRSRSRPRAAC